MVICVRQTDSKENKMRKRKMTSFSIDAEVLDAIKAEAKKEGRSIRAYIDQYFSKKFGIDLTKDEKGE